MQASLAVCPGAYVGRRDLLLSPVKCRADMEPQCQMCQGSKWGFGNLPPTAVRHMHPAASGLAAHDGLLQGLLPFQACPWSETRSNQFDTGIANEDSPAKEYSEAVVQQARTCGSMRVRWCLGFGSARCNMQCYVPYMTQVVHDGDMMCLRQ